MRVKWKKKHPKHLSGGASEVVIVKLRNGEITSDRYLFRQERWEKYTSIVVFIYSITRNCIVIGRLKIDSKIIIKN